MLSDENFNVFYKCVEDKEEDDNAESLSNSQEQSANTVQLQSPEAAILIPGGADDDKLMGTQQALKFPPFGISLNGNILNKKNIRHYIDKQETYNFIEQFANLQIEVHKMKHTVYVTLMNIIHEIETNSKLY
ncbi:hypothetical protein POVCU1_077540 [Plasmodium ovale curtisi]|uniref:Uncharacterized protein n=1 Tax=Plasmodium ovale curtisi TaxID=864141 RepID=A0A1A8XB90_PLAOA|nr:hypothetical protein POVCU1_077540 [Plasmodium ovale curtisi]